MTKITSLNQLINLQEQIIDKKRDDITSHPGKGWGADKFAPQALKEDQELDAPRVQLGMTAKINADGLPGREFTGHVVRMSPKMGRKELWSDQPTERYDTKTREVWIELDGKEQWVVGLRLDVILVTDNSNN